MIVVYFQAADAGTGLGGDNEQKIEYGVQPQSVGDEVKKSGGDPVKSQIREDRGINAVMRHMKLVSLFVTNIISLLSEDIFICGRFFCSTRTGLASFHTM